MRTDRDTILICLALAPLGFMIFVCYQWQVTGSFPVGLFSWAAPDVPLPTIPAIVFPAAAVMAWRQFASNDIAIGVSVLAGLAAGVVAVGILGDGVRMMSRLIHRSEKEQASEPQQLEFPEPQRAEPYTVR